MSAPPTLRLTKAVRAELREIVELFFRDAEEGGCHAEALTRLCRISGMVWPAGEMLMNPTGEMVPLDEIKHRALTGSDGGGDG